MPQVSRTSGPHSDDPAAPSVLIVDDSVVARSVIARMVDATGRFMVAGSVPDAHSALRFLRNHRVDAILLDVEMPGMNGLTALPELLAAGQGAKVLIVSSSAEAGAVTTLKALALGAADTLVKPGIGSFSGRFAEVLNDKLTRLVEPAPVVSLPGKVTRIKGGAVAAVHYDIVAIGASTGGIHALSGLLRAIPPSFQIPILITQHLPASFMPYFANQLAVLAGRPCVVAEDRARILPGQIMVAPGHAHMRVVRIGDGTAIRLADDPQPSGCMPSVDPMFASIAEAYGKRALCVVLSGMGRDGVIGAAKLKQVGAGIVVQDQESSVVWGMPGSVATAGLAGAVLPPADIGTMIANHRRPA